MEEQISKSRDFDFKPDLQRGVPKKSVGGAALLTAGLALAAGNSVALSGAAAVFGAIGAMQKGDVGEVLRKVGGATWAVTQATTNALKDKADIEDFRSKIY